MSEFFERVVYAMLEAEADLDPMSARTVLSAALKAMREPTVSMFDAFMSRNTHRIEPHDENVFWEGDFGQFAASWLAMIDQAIKEGE